MVLTTLGYEGLSTAIFFEELIKNEVKTIVDVRELPISRKSGFSKKALISQASLLNIQYIHVKSLGCPRDIRHDYRENKDWVYFTQRYISHLKFQEEDLQALANRVNDETCCLLCFEANHLYCHRRYVADALQNVIGPMLQINHLAPKGKEVVP